MAFNSSATPGPIITGTSPWKYSVVAASTSNSALSGADTFDGIALVTGMRVLAKNQTNPILNGIYIVNTGGAWTRATDFDAVVDARAGDSVYIEQGTQYAATYWTLTAPTGTISVGVSPLTFTNILTRASGAAQVAVGATNADYLNIGAAVADNKTNLIVINDCLETADILLVDNLNVEITPQANVDLATYSFRLNREGIRVTFSGQGSFSTAKSAPGSLFDGAYITFIGDIATGFPTLLNTTLNTANLKVGQSIVGNFIPDGTRILSIDGPNSLTMTQNATNTVVGNTINFGNCAGVRLITDGALTAFGDDITVANVTLFDGLEQFVNTGLLRFSEPDFAGFGIQAGGASSVLSPGVLEFTSTTAGTNVYNVLTAEGIYNIVRIGGAYHVSNPSISLPVGGTIDNLEVTDIGSNINIAIGGTLNNYNTPLPISIQMIQNGTLNNVNTSGNDIDVNSQLEVTLSNVKCGDVLNFVPAGTAGETIFNNVSLAVNEPIIDRKNNFYAVVPPTTGDDDTQKFQIGSQWVDTAAGTGYICVDNTTGAAVWKTNTAVTNNQVTAGTGGMYINAGAAFDAGESNILVINTCTETADVIACSSDNILVTLDAGATWDFGAFSLNTRRTSMTFALLDPYKSGSSIRFTGTPRWQHCDLPLFTADTSSGFPTVTNTSINTSFLRVGQDVSCSDFGADARILSIDSPTSFTVDQNASATTIGASFGATPANPNFDILNGIELDLTGVTVPFTYLFKGLSFFTFAGLTQIHLPNVANVGLAADTASALFNTGAVIFSPDGGALASGVVLCPFITCDRLVFTGAFNPALPVMNVTSPTNINELLYLDFGSSALKLSYAGRIGTIIQSFGTGAVDVTFTAANSYLGLANIPTGTIDIGSFSDCTLSDVTCSAINNPILTTPGLTVLNDVQISADMTPTSYGPSSSPFHRQKTITFPQSPYTPAIERVINADATGGSITVNLPTPSNYVGRVFVVKKSDVSANPVIVAATSIDGVPAYTLSQQYDAVSVVSLGASYAVITQSGSMTSGWTNTGTTLYTTNTSTFVGVGTATPLTGTHIANGLLLEALVLGDFPVGGTIGSAATTVDVKPTIAITQTTYNQSLFLPNPTSNATGHTCRVINTGSAGFEMQGVPVPFGGARDFVFSNIGVWSPTSPAGFTELNNASYGEKSFKKNLSGNRNTAIGVFTLAGNLTGNDSTAVGYSALENNTANFNTAIGSSAMQGNTSGTSNTAVGYSVMETNLNGSNNCAFGLFALRYNQSGGENCAFGLESLKENVTGERNVAFGTSALRENFGDDNTAIGRSALILNTFGLRNTAVGANALDSNTFGNDNIAIGYSALSANTVGNENVAIGRESLQVSTTSGNTAVGTFALKAATSGTGNVAVGRNALRAITTPSDCVAIGEDAISLGDGGERNIAVGRSALENVSSFLGSDNVAVGHQALQANTFAGGNTAVGATALKATTTGSQNTAIGNGAMAANTLGALNIAVGTGALGSNTTGGSNTAVGYTTMTANTTGSNNVAMGIVAMLQNTTGASNTAMGTGALRENTTGNNNAAFGSGALNDNTTGLNNVAVGFEALGDSTTVDNTVAVGKSALRLNTTGANNTAIGTDALSSNITGDFNVAVGNNALKLNTAQKNTGVGYNSLAANTSGSLNVALGGESLAANTTGNANVAVGEQTLNSNTTGSGNVAVGRDCMSANTTGGNNTSVGWNALISNTTSGSNVAVGNAALFNNDASFNTACGAVALEDNTTGAENFAGGYASLQNNTTGNLNTACGNNAGDTITTGSHNTFLGAGTDSSSATGTGRIAIGRSSAGVAASATIDDGLFFHTSLATVVSVAVNYDAATGQMGPVTSSRRFKENIVDMATDSSRIFELRPVEYNREGSSAVEFGYIAEEVVDVLPQIVPVDKDGLPFSVNYERLVVLLVEELKTLRSRVEELENQIVL